MEDRCVCCGEIIPEGRMVCVNCEKMITSDNQLYIIQPRHNGRTYYMELIKKWKKLIGLSTTQN